MEPSVEIMPLDVSDEAALQAWYDVYRAALTHDHEFHTAYALEEVRAGLRAEHTGTRRFPLQAVVAGELAGVADARLSLQDNLSSALVSVCVRPDRWGRGIGTALLTAAEQIVRAEGRTIAQGEACYPMTYPADGRGHPAVEFALRRGYALGLGDVQRVLDLPVPGHRLAELEAEAAPKHVGYTFVSYVGPGPDELVLEIAALRAALDSEAPVGDLHRERGHVDLERVRADERDLAEAGRVRVGVAVLAPDGRVAGYTDLVVPEFDPPWVYQWGTLVWSEHRGHALGLALKVRNLAAVQKAYPDRGAVRTWNAEVNAPMIAVNEAMGFRAVDRMGEFQKLL